MTSFYAHAANQQSDGVITTESRNFQHFRTKACDASACGGPMVQTNRSANHGNSITEVDVSQSVGELGCILAFCKVCTVTCK